MVTYDLVTLCKKHSDFVKKKKKKRIKDKKERIMHDSHARSKML